MNISIFPELAAGFILIFARIGVLVMMMPGTGERAIPVRMRLALGILVTLTIMPAVQPLLKINAADPLGLVSFLLVEVLIGLMLGTFVRFALTALQSGGVIIATQLGLAFAQTVDPTQDQNSATFANFMVVLGLTLIFALDLHHLSIRALYDSYQIFAPGTLVAPGDASQLIVKAAADSFRVGVQLSAPFLVFGVVFNAGLGILSRLMPQMQVFFVAMPASILLGFAILLAIISVLMVGFLDHLEATLNTLIVR
jgi:flagellar biosynthesis protein FliR